MYPVKICYNQSLKNIFNKTQKGVKSSKKIFQNILKNVLFNIFKL